jgi:6-phosphogluconolactonase (cycloisomerase 2 family)
MPRTSFGARALRLLVVPLALAAGTSLPSCGTDGGVSAFLPPGPPTQAPPGDIVVYAAMAIGSRIDAFRLGEDGLMPEEPFDSIYLTNPRRLAIANGVLYASLFDRVVSIRLGADGSLPNVPTGISAARTDYDPIDVIVRDNILYVAGSGLGVVQSFELDENGDIPVDPDAVGTGEFSSDFSSLALEGDYLYAGARDTQLVELFLLEQDGNVPEQAEAQEPDDNIALPEDIAIRDGILYVTSASDRSIRAYRIQPNGFLAGEEDSRTKSEEYYSDIFLEGDTLYAAAYNAGRIDLFNVSPDGMLPEEAPFFKTQADPTSYPARMILHRGILYVTTAGHNRIDAYVIGSNGIPPMYPTSSTTPTANSLPLDIAIHELD